MKINVYHSHIYVFYGVMWACALALILGLLHYYGLIALPNSETMSAAELMYIKEIAAGTLCIAASSLPFIAKREMLGSILFITGLCIIGAMMLQMAFSHPHPLL